MNSLNWVKRLLPSVFRDKYRHRWHSIRGRILSLPSVRKAKWRLFRQEAPSQEDGSVNLHLGCGPINHSAFTNIDIVPYSHIHYLRPINDLTIFEDESVDLIYASHCLEHFSFREVSSVLSEWARVLKKGGIIRISVPDFDSILETYEAAGRILDPVLEAIVGGQDYQFNFHYVVFNRDYLRRQLEQASFTDIKEWEPGSTVLTTFDDWSSKEFIVGEHKFPISLNLEARK